VRTAIPNKIVHQPFTKSKISALFVACINIPLRSG
jgi:hypothetical protein